ncbi:CDP-glucose 4,6-dehydratase [Gammaproteobacteria bacterium]|nr:CDP-glucose 4,6-dehydratase [Gammaproteobacteria bacterium]
MKTSFWTGKKVLVTGHSGFKGCWITLLLKYLGAEVCGVSSSTLNNNQELYLALNLDDNCLSYDIDIRDKNISKIFYDFKPDIVFHLAAQPLVRASYEIPFDTYDINVMGTLNVLENIRKSSSVAASVMITTDKCYENKEWVWGYRETDRLGGFDPYSSSKACAELLIKSFQNSYESESLAISSVRAGNVIGGGDLSSDRLLPDIYRAILSNQKIKLRNPTATRPWQHVLEPLMGYLMVAEDLFVSGHKNNDAWNFGPRSSDIRTVAEIAKLFAGEWGIDSIIEEKSPKNYHEANILSLDSTKANSKLSWQPVWNVEIAIKKTAEWYQAFEKNLDILDKTNQQIQEYISTTKL